MALSFTPWKPNNSPVKPTLANQSPSASLLNLNVNPQASTLPNLSQQTYLGIQAKSPAVQKPTNTISTSQAKPPTLPSLVTNKATLYGPTGTKPIQVGVGSSEASSLQSQGWGLTPGSYKAPTNTTTPTVTAPVVQKPTDITSAGILKPLVETSQQGSPVAQEAQSTLMGLSKENAATSGPAYQQQQKVASDINALDQEYAAQKAAMSSDPNLSIEFKQGREQVIDQQYSARRAALSNQLVSAQQAVGQQITGVQTQQSGVNQAGGLAQTGQQMTQTGLTSAAQLAQPVQVPYGIPLVSPQTGTQVGGTGGGVQPSDPFYKTMESYANLLATNQGSAVPSSITSNSVLNAQLIEMAKKINPSFNVNVATGAGAAQTSTAGSQSQQIQALQSALQQGQNLQSQFKDLLNNFGLNPSDINKANQGLQVIANNISDPRYQILQNYINDIANTYAQILTPAGGNVTDQTRSTASSMLNATMSGQGLQTVMQSLDEAAKAKIAGVPTSGGLGTPSTSGNSAYNAGQTNATGELKWDGSKWVKA